MDILVVRIYVHMDEYMELLMDFHKLIDIIKIILKINKISKNAYISHGHQT